MVRDKERYLINSVLRAAKILESFSLEKSTYTNTEISKKLGINKSSVTRLLYSLEETGFLERDMSTGAYRLTFKLYKLGNIYIKKAKLHREAMPLLSELALLTKETAHLALLQKNEVVIIDWVETSQSIGLMGLTGLNLPAYCTALGKVLLAYQDEAFLKKYFESLVPKRYTGNTITEKNELRRQFKMIRSEGYAFCNGELEEDVVGVASPLMDNTGKLVASISITGPSFRMLKKDVLSRIIASVKEAAEQISLRLGFLDEK